MTKYVIMLINNIRGDYMIGTIVVTINNRKYQYNKDTTLEEIAKDQQKHFKYPIVLAKVDNKLKELSTVAKDRTNITFLDLTSREGNRCHINGLVYIMLYAVKKLYGKKADIIVQHSLDKGIFIKTTFKLTEEKVEEIKKCMNTIIQADIPITKVTIDRMEAIKYFEGINDETKAGVMKYNTNNYVTLYRLGNLYNYFYNLMPTSTEKVKDFDLTYIKENGLVLRFPTVYINDKIKLKANSNLMIAVGSNINKIVHAIDKISK